MNDSISQIEPTKNMKSFKVILWVLILALLIIFIGYNIYRSYAPTISGNNPGAITEVQKVGQLNSLGATTKTTSQAQKIAQLNSLGTASGAGSNTTQQQKTADLNSLSNY